MAAPTITPVNVDPQYPSPCGKATRGEIRCLLNGGAVDIYYWPEPAADNACLDIVGNNTNSPLPGATTSTDLLEIPWPYWGCTAQHPVSGSTVITTATEVIAGTVTLKEPVLNPWAPQPCVGSVPFFTNGSSRSIGNLVTTPSLETRDHSLVIPPSITENGSLQTTTVVVDKYARLNSPRRKRTGICLNPGSHIAPSLQYPKNPRNINPLFEMCQNMYFTALDPPRTLVVAKNLAPQIFTTHSQAHTMLSMPSRDPDPHGNEHELPSRTAPAPQPAQTLKPPQPQQTASPASHVNEKSSGNKYEDSTDSSGGPREDADPPHNKSPSAEDSNPPQEPVFKPSSESGGNADPEQKPNQSNSGPSIVNGEHRPDAKSMVDSQINSVTDDGSGKEAGSSDPSIPKITNEEPGMGVDAKPDFQSGTSGDPGRVAESDRDSGGHFGSDSAINVAMSSDYSGQGPEALQGNNLAIGNQNPGEAATINGQIAAANPTAVDAAGATLVPGRDENTVSGTRLLRGPVGELVGPSKRSSVKMAVETLSQSIIGRLNSTEPSGATLAASTNGVQAFRGSATAL